MSKSADHFCTALYIQPTHKFPSPERYQGSHDGFLCLAWLQALSFYAKAIKAPAADWTRIAVSYLTGAAILWWHGSGLSDDSTFEEFTKACYSPKDSKTLSASACTAPNSPVRSPPLSKK